MMVHVRSGARVIWANLIRQLEDKRMIGVLHQKLGIRKSLGLPENANFLDCGCGASFLCFEAANDGFKAYGFEVMCVKRGGFLVPFGDKFFRVIVLYLGLTGLTNFLAKLFPYRSLSIDIIALKK